jgi:glycosyltransferase involved in cell wall biosynthesis
MTLAIIVPVLNEGAALMERLQALQPLRARGAELLMVDGGSTDASAVAAAPLVDQLLAAPRGRAAQMNAGAARARGDILLFLHADTRLPDTALAAGHRGGRCRCLLGAFRCHHRRAHRWPRHGRGDDESAVAAHRHRHRRSGPLRARAAFEQAGGFPDIR